MKDIRRAYHLDRVEDMIALAQHVQVMVYWNDTYRDEYNQEIPYKSFWGIIAEYPNPSDLVVVIEGEYLYIK